MRSGRFFCWSNSQERLKRCRIRGKRRAILIIDDANGSNWGLAGFTPGRIRCRIVPGLRGIVRNEGRLTFCILIVVKYHRIGQEIIQVRLIRECRRGEQPDHQAEQ